MSRWWSAAKVVLSAAVLILAIAAFGSLALAQSSSRVANLVEKSRRAIVKISVTGHWPNGEPHNAEGTGFFVYSANRWSFLLTATHVLGSSEQDPGRNLDWLVENGVIDRKITLSVFDETGKLVPVKGEISLGPTLSRDPTQVNAVDIALLVIHHDGYPTLSLNPVLTSRTETRDVVLLGVQKEKEELSEPVAIAQGAMVVSNGITYRTTLPSRPGESGGPWIDLDTGVVLAVAREVHSNPGNPSNESTPVALVASVVRSYSAETPSLPAQAQPTDTRADEVVWTIIEKNPQPQQLLDFISRFPTSPLLSQAQTRLKALQPAPATQTASTDTGCVTPTNVDFRGRKDGPLALTEECSLRSRTEFRECPDCPPMIVVPSGSSTLGSPPTEAGRFSDEGPQISITIKAPFAVGKFPVTVSEFSTFISESGYKTSPESCYVLRSQLRTSTPQYPSNKSVGYAPGAMWQQSQYGWNNSPQYDAPVVQQDSGPRYLSTLGYSWRNPGFSQTKKDPVVCVNWYDAVAYAAWLSKKTGKDYRLMSEAEFEYMARGQTDTGSYRIFSFGNDPRQLCRFGNGNPKFTDTSGSTSYYCDDGYQFTAPVGTYQPNAFGIYDVFGNALEWTQDCYHNSHSGNSGDGAPWLLLDCKLRSLRGGSWDTWPDGLRAAFRRRGDPSVRISDVGFRIARSLKAQSSN